MMPPYKQRNANLLHHPQRLWNFDLTVLTHEKNGDEWYKNVRVVDHMLDFEIGAHEIYWKVPALKDNGLVSLSHFPASSLNSLRR